MIVMSSIRSHNCSATISNNILSSYHSCQSTEYCNSSSNSCTCSNFLWKAVYYQCDPRQEAFACKLVNDDKSLWKWWSMMVNDDNHNAIDVYSRAGGEQRRSYSQQHHYHHRWYLYQVPIFLLFISSSLPFSLFNHILWIDIPPWWSDISRWLQTVLLIRML